MKHRTLCRVLLTASLTATLGLAACDSDDDDGRGSAGGDSGEMPGGGSLTSQLLVIAQQPANSDPIRFNEEGLEADITSRYGESATAEPLVVPEGTDILTVLRGQ